MVQLPGKLYRNLPPRVICPDEGVSASGSGGSSAESPVRAIQSFSIHMPTSRARMPKFEAYNDQRPSLLYRLSSRWRAQSLARLDGSVFMLGEAGGVFIYVRHLMLIHRQLAARPSPRRRVPFVPAHCGRELRFGSGRRPGDDAAELVPSRISGPG